MPSTLTGLLLFLVLLLPGFAYLVGKERTGTERRTSPFRETVAIVAASVAAELVVVTVSAAAWAWSVDLGRVLTDLPGYWREHPVLLAGWAVGLLAASTALAFAATVPGLRRRTRWITGEYPHMSAVSAWWVVFEQRDPTARKHVGCMLDDGSYVAGNLVSFNNDASDTSDRDLILGAPINYRAPGDDELVPYPASAVCISARRIVSMFVTYRDPDDATSSPEAGPADPRADAE
ncbi:DUF6338 family protein [Amycolatopsis thermoflava]|uniref:DUF6338 family protein n=1 Tax=Amycolatopsis thermoflava TaxID=84480 RepID=UPI003F49DE7C